MNKAKAAASGRIVQGTAAKLFYMGEARPAEPVKTIRRIVLRAERAEPKRGAIQLGPSRPYNVAMDRSWTNVHVARRSCPETKISRAKCA